MTTERRIVALLTDIKLISYVCRNCGAKFSFPPTKMAMPHGQCPACHHQWLPNKQPGSGDQRLNYERDSIFYRLLDAIADLNSPEVGGNYGFFIALEFEEPSHSQSVSQKSGQA